MLQAGIPLESCRRSIAMLLNLREDLLVNKRKYECRYQGVQKTSIFDTERSRRFEADEEKAGKHLAVHARRVGIAGGAKSLFRHKRTLAASISFVAVIAAGWLIRDSALYERTDAAQVDGRIIPLSARIRGQVQQVNVVDGQLVHAGDVLAIIDQREYSIALLEALANLAYAQNSAAALYFKAAITTSTGYGDLSAAKSTATNASVEVETAEHKLRADQKVLEQAQADGPLAEAVAAADQQVLLQAQDKLAKAITNLRAA
jgi:multidrug resistance efflux pump